MVEVEVEVEVAVEDAGAEWNMVAPKVWSLEEYGGPALGRTSVKGGGDSESCSPAFPPR